MEISDEQKKRNLVSLLLSKDISFNRKFLPEIQNFDSEYFDKLFSGDSNTKYPVKNGTAFKNLVNKFNNFNVVLEEWYNDSTYINYLEELWTNNIIMERLKNLDDIEEMGKKLTKAKVKFTTWPEKVQNEFCNLVNNTGNTEYEKLKDYMNNNDIEIKRLLSVIHSLKKDIQNSDLSELEKKVYITNTDNTFNLVVDSMIISLGLEEQLNSKISLCLKNDLEKENKSKTNEEANSTSEKFKEMLEGYINSLGIEKKFLIQKFGGGAGIGASCCKKCPLRKVGEKLEICDMEKKGRRGRKFWKKGKYKQLFLYALSFLNLGISVVELEKTLNLKKKAIENISEYKKEFDNIKSSYESHKINLGILSGELHERIKKIEEIQKNISSDLKNLNE